MQTVDIYITITTSVNVEYEAGLQHWVTTLLVKHGDRNHSETHPIY